VPPIERSYRRQWAVLWEPAGLDNFGEARVAAPREVRVRWTDTRSDEAGGGGGSEPHDATVVVGERIVVDSIMWKGRLSEWDPSKPQDLMMGLRYSETPDIKVRFTAREVALRRFREKLPAVAP
jgi:hypothetical protein